MQSDEYHILLLHNGRDIPESKLLTFWKWLVKSEFYSSRRVSLNRVW